MLKRLKRYIRNLSLVNHLRLRHYVSISRTTNWRLIPKGAFIIDPLRKGERLRVISKHYELPKADELCIDETVNILLRDCEGDELYITVIDNEHIREIIVATVLEAG